MEMNRRSFIAAILIAPFAPKLVEQVKPKLWSFDIETVPMPTCLVVDSVTDAWKILMEEKIAKHGMRYGMDALRLKEILNARRDAGR